MTALVVDSSCLAHISKHSMKGLSFYEKETGVIFGFMLHLLRLAERFSTKHFVFCWDSRKSRRRELFPDYKSSRRKENLTDQEIWENDIARLQFDQLRREIIPRLGFQNQFVQSGYEADDLIARVVGQSNGEWIVVSTDGDLYQLLNDNTTIFNPMRKKVYTNRDFCAEYDIPSSRWAEVRSLVGCSSDSVPGILGVGEKTAIRFLKDELPKSSKAFQRIVSNEGAKIVNRNATLVTLPFPGTKECVVNFNSEILFLDSFRDMCGLFGFRSFLKDESKWVRAFDLK